MTKRYGTAQFKLNKTRVQHGLNMTRFSFYMHATMRVYATLNLLFNALVHALDVYITVADAHVHDRNAHAKFELHMHANCKPGTVE